MTSKDVLEHWMDPLSPELVNRIAKLVMDLHRGELNDGAGIEFDMCVQKAEKELDVGSYVLIRLSHMLARELKDYLHRSQTIQFLDKILRRAGQCNFGSLLNLIFYSELDNVEKLSSQLLDLANQNRDPIQQLLAVILICKTHDQKRRYQECRSLYEKIEPLLQRAYKLSHLKTLNSEQQYYFFTSCFELSRLHMKHENYESRVDILYKALAMISNQEENYDLFLKAGIMLLRALKRITNTSAVKEHSKRLMEMIDLIIRLTSNGEILVMKYCFELREAFFEVSFTLENLGEPEFMRTMDNLMDVHVNLLGQNHHEVALLAAIVAKHYYVLGETRITKNLITISELGLKHGNETLETVMRAKIRTVRMLAYLFHDSKNFEETKKYRLEDLRLNRKCFGMFHHFVSRSLQLLSRLLRDKGDREGALQYLEQSLEIMLICQPQFSLRHKELEREIQNLRMM